ncbi:hypothetical protein WICANDRAFT_60397 [Wickerhamomyces anomalus NRRL Y-366-8]|uniref:DUF1748-domain-containing protein n=1 Tax=Wickerhamomyces anomalus (strain ATCC 58044 / CBS 1984 / NCYC 433 / NRRL Y-366-8) TaxID=683960 RepID=A0A1E3PA97_WICAA|nr:uncharacterized protein WICANDRAFT_60397 [Wickerhamomyces anomalus NRRL Y-366-8]ODQ62336.1 hypothetical protein WICANDRAFT_60397 [Wickerhamomyces anomalus NRRL Y-366-8]
MGILGKAIHLSVDLVLVSTALAGIKRNTGLTPKTEIAGNTEVQGYLGKYLDVGEYVFDSSVGIMNASGYFVRK